MKTIARGLIGLCLLVFAIPAKADIVDDCGNASDRPDGIEICTKALSAAANDKDRAVALAGRANSYLITGECQKGNADWAAAKKYFPALNDEGKEVCKKK